MSCVVNVNWVGSWLFCIADKDPRRGSSQRNDRMKQDDEGQEPIRKPQLPFPTAKAKAKGVSKWNDYIAQDDNDNLQLGSGRNFEHQLHYHTLEFETINNDQRVEDDVHPDFLWSLLHIVLCILPSLIGCELRPCKHAMFGCLDGKKRKYLSFLFRCFENWKRREE